MKKIHLILIYISLAIGLGTMLIITLQKIEQEDYAFSQITILPEFVFTDIETGNEFSNNQLKIDIPTLFIYFNTECEHCQVEISQINKNIDNFNNTQIVMISFEEPTILLEKLKHTNLLNSDNVFILFDSKNEFQKISGDCPFPTSLIYNEDQKLIKVFKGEVRVEALLKYLKK